MKWNDISRSLGESKWKFWFRIRYGAYFVLRYHNDIELAKWLFNHFQYMSQYGSIASCGAQSVLNMVEY